MQIIAEALPSSTPSESGFLSSSFFNLLPRAPISQVSSSPVLSKMGLDALAPQDRGARDARRPRPHDPGSATATAAAADPEQVDPGADSAKSFTPNPDPPVNWYVAAEAPGYNNVVHADFFQKIKKAHGKGESYAVFDWDNTSMFGDISYTSVYYQVDNLDFRLAPEKFADAFSLGYTNANGDECLPHGINAVLGKDVNGTDVTVAQAINATVQDYKFLYDAYIAPAHNLTAVSASGTNVTVMPLTLAQVETTEFLNFRAKLAFLAFRVEGSLDMSEHAPRAIRISMTVLTQLLVGMMDAEIRASVRWNLGVKLDSPSYKSTESLAVQGDYSTGLRVLNGQETVMRSLRAYGTDVHIISASPQVFVEEVGKLLSLGCMAPTTNVWGVRFTTEDGKFFGKLIDNYPIT